MPVFPPLNLAASGLIRLHTGGNISRAGVHEIDQAANEEDISVS